MQLTKAIAIAILSAIASPVIAAPIKGSATEASVLAVSEVVLVEPGKVEYDLYDEIEKSEPGKVKYDLYDELIEPVE
jgi:hypothetical protein